MRSTTNGARSGRASRWGRGTRRGGLALALLLALASWCAAPVGAQEPHTRLVGQKLLGRWEAEKIEQLLRSGTLRGLAAQSRGIMRKSGPCKLGVRAYRLEYRTRGTLRHWITASGLLLVPDVSGSDRSFPLLSYQHGNILRRMDCPSSGTNCVEARLAMGVFASHGYVVAMPDYLGQGISPQAHPYLQASTEASAALDMMRASREWLERLRVPLDGRTFLAGYSQGGHATMALSKLIQQRFSHEFSVTGTAVISGPYDLVMAWRGWASKPTHVTTAIMARLVTSWSRMYGFLPGDAFQAPYDQVAPSVLDGNHPGEQVLARLPADPKKLFKGSFLDEVTRGKGLFARALVQNNVYDWAPSSPIRLYHARKDQVVPFAISERAVSAFARHGVSTWVTDLGPVTHQAAAIPGCVMARLWFDTLVQ